MNDQPRTVDDFVPLMKKVLLEEVPGDLASAYLFGSLAEGREHRESDVDVGIPPYRDHYPDPAIRFHLKLRLSSALTSAFGGRTADVVILNDAPPGFGRRIVTEGRRILCADEEGDHAFVRDVQLLAADLEPFLRRMRKMKLEALSRP